MKISKTLIALNLALAAACFALDAKVLYFNPAQTTTVDGKFTLVAVKEKVGNDEYVFYRYARPKKGTNTELRLVSGRVFGAFEDGPDPRGYGPSLTRTSKKYDGVNPEVVGELIATQFQARKWSGVVVHKYNKNKGIYEQNREIRKLIVDVEKKAEKEMRDGIVAALGSDYQDKYYEFYEWGGTSLIEKRYSTASEKEEWQYAESNTFDPSSVDYGLGLEFHAGYYLSPKDENTPQRDDLFASYTIQAVLTIDAEGKPVLTEISRLIETPKAAPVAVAQITGQERILNQEARKILQQRIVEPENEGETEAVPANEQ